MYNPLLHKSNQWLNFSRQDAETRKIDFMLDPARTTDWRVARFFLRLYSVAGVNKKARG